MFTSGGLVSGGDLGDGALWPVVLERGPGSGGREGLLGIHPALWGRQCPDSGKALLSLLPGLPRSGEGEPSPEDCKCVCFGGAGSMGMGCSGWGCSGWALCSPSQCSHVTGICHSILSCSPRELLEQRAVLEGVQLDDPLVSSDL